MDVPCVQLAITLLPRVAATLLLMGVWATGNSNVWPVVKTSS